MANPTSNMGLTLPDVSVTPGPTWASQINSDLTLIDQHSHVPNTNGGVPITSAALQIDADVEFNTILPGGAAAKGLSFLGLLAPVGTANVPTRIYSNDVGDLYYDNSAGVPVRLTNGANVAGVQGSITNLTSPASADYNSGTGTFKWESAANTGASMDSGPVTVRDGSAGANGITITPPSGLAAAYTLTLPGSAPSGQRLMTANAGVSSFASVDSTLTLTSSLLKVAPLGITAAQLATDAVETAKIKDEAVTQQKTQIKPVQYSSDILSVSTTSTTPVNASGLSCLFIALSGRPLCVELLSIGGAGSKSDISATSGDAYAYIEATPPGGPTSLIATVYVPNGGQVPVTALRQVIINPSAGLYSFQVKFNVGIYPGSTAYITRAKLVAYPL